MDDIADVVEHINTALGIDGVITFKGDELKCWTGVDRDRTYLDADACQALADAFGTLALLLGKTQATPNGGVSDAK